MKSKAILMALLAFAFQAQAVPVTRTQASVAARTWASKGTAFGQAVQAVVEQTSEHAATNGATFYSVLLRGGGTVIVSGDTDEEPIVAFTPERVDLRSLDQKSPLWDLLNTRFVPRQGQVRQVAPSSPARLLGAAASSVAAGTDMPEPETPAQLRWAKLLEGSSPRRLLGAVEPVTSNDYASVFEDLRVDALLKTKWGQSTMAYASSEESKGGYADCFNLKTPGNCVCGCVATAFAQLMRYHCWPVEAVEGFEGKCKVQGEDQKLTFDGGAFDWANMPETILSADETEREAQCEAIGTLTYACGVAVNMMYDDPDGSGSGAQTKDVVPALTEKFGYANAKWLAREDYLTNDEATREQYVYTSLDAGFPVIFSIRGPLGGHAVVGDGYGYSSISGERTPYIHLNMGWTGANDWWYCFPNIDVGSNPESFSGFDQIQGVAYNVFTNETGKIVSGRVLDRDGVTPVSGALVTVIVDGETRQTVTSPYGVYAFVLANGEYDIEASSAESVGTVGVTVGFSGNTWGNDIVMGPPSVEVAGRLYSSLNGALREAVDGDVVRILLPTELRRSCIIDRNISFVATNDMAAAAPIVRLDGATLSVTNGVAFFSNVVFQAEASTPVLVRKPGQVRVAGAVAFDDLTSGVPGIVTDDPSCFVLAGELDGGITVECETATENDDPFGCYDCAESVAEVSARRLVSTNGTGRAGAARPGGILRWEDDAVIDPLAAVAYVDGRGVAANVYYRSLDKLLDEHKENVRVMITRAGTVLERTHALSGESEVVGADGVTRVVVTAATGLTVSGGDSLSVSGLAFEGFKGNGLLVADGVGTKLNVSESVFSDIEGTNFHSGAVSALRGASLTVSGAVFSNCRATGRHLERRGLLEREVPGNSFGGAVYVAEGGSLSLQGVDAPISVTGCLASAGGGGIYVKASKSSPSKVTIAGNVKVSGNTSGTTGLPDDINLNSGLGSVSLTCQVSDFASGRRSIGLAQGVKDDVFGTYATDVEPTAAELLKVRQAFFVSINESLSAETDGVNLVWSDVLDTTVPQAESVCSLSVSGGAPAYYATLADAVRAADGDAVITLTEDVSFDEDLEIGNAVRIVSGVGGPFAVSRGGNAKIRVIAGGALTLGDVRFDGCAGKENTSGLFLVDGGSLKLSEGAVVCNVKGSDDRCSSAISVFNRGSFTMESGALIQGCRNEFLDIGTAGSYGGALKVEDHSTAWLNGGEISDCSAWWAGGVFVGTYSTVYLSGNMTIDGNWTLDDFGPDNLSVADDSQLILAGDDFTGQVGFNEGYQADEVVFGQVDDGFGGADLQAAAHLFTHDFTGDVGMAVTDGERTLLVWSSALDKNGEYTDEEGTIFSLVEGEEVAIDEPTFTQASYVYDGTEQVAIEESLGYELVSGTSGTDAGEYTAVVRLRAGYAWSSDLEGDWTGDWAIGKASYNMSGVSFEDATYAYDQGKTFRLDVTGELPEGVTVSYENNDQWQVGAYVVTANFAGDADNFKPIPPMSATLTIDGETPPPPPPPGPTVVTNTPDPIAFQSISSVDADTWTLVVTNRVPYCNYRILYTDDLTKGFVNTGAWEQAIGTADEVRVWTTNVVTGGGQWYWKAEATEGTNVVIGVEGD